MEMTTYYCEQCNYSSPSGLYFQRHLDGNWHKSGSGPRPVYKCDICKWVTSQGKKHYVAHMNSVTHKKNEHIREVKSTGYYCDLCAYETMDKSNYERHMRTEQHRKKKERKAKAGIHCSKDFNFDKPIM